MEYIHFSSSVSNSTMNVFELLPNNREVLLCLKTKLVTVVSVKQADKFNIGQWLFHGGVVSDESSSSSLCVNFLETLVFLLLLDDAERSQQ